MQLFKFQKGKLSSIGEKKFDLERDLQKATEDNLEQIFGLEFVASEFNIQGKRIDTLAFDSELKTFVIIEYKRGRSFSVVDQGYAYLSLMLNNKADFILEYNEEKDTNLKRGDIDWSQSKVTFIARSFTDHQKLAINFKDLPIELWEAKKFGNDLVTFHQLTSPDSAESINTISGKSEEIREVSREVKKYTIDDHFKEGWEESRELFAKLVERLENAYEQVSIKPVKYYMGVKINGSANNIIALKSQRSLIRIELLRVQPKDLDDPKEEAKYRKNSFQYYNKHVTDFDIKSEEDIDYAMSLIKQVYDKFSR